MPSKYLVHINSRPQPGVGVDDEGWVKWYIEEHLPDMVNSKTATRVALYRERYDFSFAAEHPHSRKYLALYESDSADPLQSKEYREGVRHSSERWPQGNPTSEIGDFDARTYKLIQDYDPHKIGDTAAPVIATVEIEPTKENIQDVDDWYRREHLDMLGKLPGYRRASRYVLEAKNPLTQGEPPMYLAIHYVDDIHSFEGKNFDAINVTPWTLKHLDEAKVAVMRMWDKVYDHGF